MNKQNLKNLKQSAVILTTSLAVTLATTHESSAQIRDILHIDANHPEINLKLETVKKGIIDKRNNKKVENIESNLPHRFQNTINLLDNPILTTEVIKHQREYATYLSFKEALPNSDITKEPNASNPSLKKAFDKTLVILKHTDALNPSWKNEVININKVKHVCNEIKKYHPDNVSITVSDLQIGKEFKKQTELNLSTSNDLDIVNISINIDSEMDRNKAKIEFNYDTPS